jgi:hypothetical protein
MPEPKPIVPGYSTGKTLPVYITATPPTATQNTITLETPAPYTGPYPQGVDMNNNFLRPSKKPEPSGSLKVNPCADGRPLVNEYDSPMTCNFVVRPNGGCPEDYFW